MYYNLDYTNDIDLSVIQYTNPNKGAGGCYISQCYYQKDNGSNVPVLFETPEFNFQNIKVNKNKPYIEVFLNEETESMFEFINNLRSYNVGYASKKSSEWFSKEMTPKFVEDYHIEMIENIDNEPKINLFLPVNNENINVDVNDFNNNPLDISELKNRKIKCIVRIETIKFLKKELYCNLMIVKIQAQKENFLDLIKSGDNDNLEIENYDQSMINFSKNDEVTDEEEADLNDEKDIGDEKEDLYIENDDENNNKIENEDCNKIENENYSLKYDQEELLKKSLDNLELEEITPMNIENLENIGNIDIDDYNNFRYEGEDDDDKISNDEEQNRLEKEIQECDTIIKEAEEEYNKKLQLLNEQEKILLQKKNHIEELKKKKNNNERHLNL